MFKQEYPATDTEAFLSSGQPIFDTDTLSWYEEACVKAPVKVGELLGYHPIFIREDEKGFLKVWEEPVVGIDYVIGADVAVKEDYSYATVINKKTFEQVAEFNARMDEFEFAYFLDRLGRYYNNALLAPEKNNQGHAVISKLTEIDYPNMYVREAIDDITGRKYNEYGWWTDRSSRYVLYSDLNEFVTKRRLIIRSQLVIDQMRSFVRNKRGEPSAISGSHDDAVMGLAIACQMYKRLPNEVEGDIIAYRDYSPFSSLNNLSKKSYE